MAGSTSAYEGSPLVPQTGHDPGDGNHGRVAGEQGIFGRSLLHQLEKVTFKVQVLRPGLEDDPGLPDGLCQLTAGRDEVSG